MLYSLVKGANSSARYFLHYFVGQWINAVAAAYRISQAAEFLVRGVVDWPKERNQLANVGLDWAVNTETTPGTIYMGTTKNWRLKNALLAV